MRDFKDLADGLFAHISEDGRGYSLREHLEATAKLAAEFAGEFGAAGWGYLAGLWHDLGTIK